MQRLAVEWVATGRFWQGYFSRKYEGMFRVVRSIGHDELSNQRYLYLFNQRRQAFKINARV